MSPAGCLLRRGGRVRPASPDPALAVFGYHKVFTC
jgi:hypothetical protein